MATLLRADSTAGLVFEKEMIELLRRESMAVSDQRPKLDAMLFSAFFLVNAECECD